MDARALGEDLQSSMIGRMEGLPGLPYSRYLNWPSVVSGIATFIGAPSFTCRGLAQEVTFQFELLCASSPSLLDNGLASPTVQDRQGSCGRFLAPLQRDGMTTCRSRSSLSIEVPYVGASAYLAVMTRFLSMHFLLFT
jgi:hypothetical protein